VNAQSVGAKPVRSIGLAWLISMPLVSTFRGYFLAHSMHVVTPGSASSRAAAIGLPQRAHRFSPYVDCRAIGILQPIRPTR